MLKASSISIARVITVTLFLFLDLFVFTGSLLAQVPSFIWAKPGVVSSAGFYSAVGTRIATDSVGNNYVTGSFSGSSFTLGSTVLTSTSGNFQTLFVAKYDAQGNLIWAKNANNCYLSYGTSIALDANAAEVYVTGVYAITSGTGTFGSQNFMPGFNSMFVAKLDASNGDVLWLKCTSVGSSQNTNTASGIGVTVYGKNSIYVTGSFKNAVSFGTINKTSVGYYDMYLAKYDSAGNVIWVQTAGYKWITGDQAIYQCGGASVTTDKSGAVYLAGQYKAGIIIGTDTYIGDASDHILIAKYDSSGNYGWSRRSNGGSSAQGASKIAIDGASNLYVSGFYGTNGISFSGTSLPYIPAGQNPVYNIFVVKYNTAGTFQWQKSPGGGFNCLSGPGIVVDKHDHFYLTGNFRTTATFGSTILTVFVNGNTEDVFVAKFDSTCNTLWAKSASGNYSDAGRDVGVDVLGNVYITGFIGAGNPNADVSFDTINVTVIANEKYFFIAKIGTNTPLTKFTVSDSVICENSTVTFTDQTPGTVTGWKWSFTGGTPASSASPNPSVRYDNPGNYDVKLVAIISGGNDSLIKTQYIHVNPLPDPGTISAQRDTICSGTPASLSVTGNSSAIQWKSSVTGNNFNEIAGATNSAFVDLPSETTYYKVMAESGSCKDSSAAFQLIVKPSPIANFSSIINNLQANFNSSGTSGDVTVFDWDFGDSTSSDLPNPVHTFSRSDTFNVCLTVFNGSNCSFTLCKDVIVGITGTNVISRFDEWNIYPVPSSDILFISSTNTEEKIDAVVIYDLLGRLVFQNNYSTRQDVIQINLSQLSKAMYYLEIRTSHENYMQKIIKE